MCVCARAHVIAVKSLFSFFKTADDFFLMSVRDFFKQRMNRSTSVRERERERDRLRERERKRMTERERADDTWTITYNGSTESRDSKH